MSDPVAVAESIRAAVTDAERGAQVSVDSVTLGIGGMEVRGAQSRGLYEFGRPHELDSGDLEYAVEWLPTSVWSAIARCCTCCRSISRWTGAADSAVRRKAVVRAWKLTFTS